MTYEPRTYRAGVDAEDLFAFEAAFRETDLQILARTELASEATDAIAAARWEIESFIQKYPRFKETLSPFEVSADAPEIVRQMASAAVKARVGPMAAVAGAIAQRVALDLVEYSDEVIVENGGDVYLIGERERVVSLFAGVSPLSDKVGLRIPAGLLPLAVCTSSGTVGHSLSFGKADAVTVLSRDGALADAVATGLANRVQGPDDIDRAIEAARQVIGVLGVVVIVGDRMGAWGNVRLVPLTGPEAAGAGESTERDDIASPS
jgi:ApbE superfamily uncharacterized protein (UPF0280 family)